MTRQEPLVLAQTNYSPLPHIVLFHEYFPLALPINLHCAHAHSDAIDRPPEEEAACKSTVASYTRRQQKCTILVPSPSWRRCSRSPRPPWPPSALSRRTNTKQGGNTQQEKTQKNDFSFLVVRSGSSTSWYKHFGSGVRLNANQVAGFAKIILILCAQNIQASHGDAEAQCQLDGGHLAYFRNSVEFDDMKYYAGISRIQPPPKKTP